MMLHARLMPRFVFTMPCHDAFDAPRLRRHALISYAIIYASAATMMSLAISLPPRYAAAPLMAMPLPPRYSMLPLMLRRRCHDTPPLHFDIAFRLHEAFR